MIDYNVFSDWIVVLSERFKQPLSLLTQGTYYDRLSERLSTEQFRKSATALFDSSAERLPGTEDWVALARSLVPDPPLPAAPEPPLISELPPEEMEKALVVIGAVRRKAITAIESSPYRSNVLSSIAVISKKILEDEAS